MIALNILMLHCYPKHMVVIKHTRSLLFIVFIMILSACGSLVPQALPTPPAPCAAGQTNTPESPCIPDTNNPTDPGNNPTNPGNNPTDPGGNPTPQVCQNSPATVRSSKSLCSSTTLKSNYVLGASDTVVMSVKLLDSTVVFVQPTIVFDIVRVNPDRSVTSVAGDLLEGRPSANPNIFEGNLSKDQLLAGLKASVAFKLKSGAPAGKYVMVLSLFKDADAYNPANLVGRIFYDLEIK